MGRAHCKQFGSSGERAVADLLRSHGRQVQRMPEHSPFDLKVDDHWKVEVKTASPTSRGASLEWQFKLIRNGELREEADYYVFRLEGVPYCKSAIHLLARSPMGVGTIIVSVRSLLNGKSSWARAFKRFAHGQKNGNGI